MVVTQGHVPTFPYYEDKINKDLEQCFQMDNTKIFHLDIEEFEYLCYLIGKRKPIFRILDNKLLNRNKYLSFKTFLYENSYHINVKKNNTFLDAFTKAKNEINTMLFDSDNN
jgi:hypothetical protein